MVVELFCFILILAYQHLFMTLTFIFTGEHFSPAKIQNTEYFSSHLTG